MPWNVGMVGFWYNKDLFTQAGIDAPAGTWDELLEQIQTLKDAGITPIAVGAGDKWPAHFWYSYLMVRLGGADGDEPDRGRQQLQRAERDRGRPEGRRARRARTRSRRASSVPVGMLPTASRARWPTEARRWT